MIYGKGDLFYGYFIDSIKQGFGYRLYPNGVCFKGEYINDRKVSGILLDYISEQLIYEGGWQNDAFHGNGYLYNPRNKSTYRGQFELGKMSGYGQMVWESGDKYEGEFRRNNLYGKGMLKMKKMDVIEGNFINGIYTGAINENDESINAQEMRQSVFSSRVSNSFGLMRLSLHGSQLSFDI